MTNCGRVVAVGITAAVAALALAQDAKGPAGEVAALARDAEAGKDVTKQAAALHKRFRSVSAAMKLFNPRGQGGIGVGRRGVGIEYRLEKLAERAPDAAAIKVEAADLVRLAHVSIVLAEASRAFAPEKPFLGRGKKEWDEDLSTVQAASRELVKAVKAEDGRAAQAAATRVFNACNRCHDGKK